MNDNFDKVNFGNKVAGFRTPAQLPDNEADRKAWQDANRSWWEQTPMRYDWRKPIAEAPGSLEYYEEIDRRFLWSVRHYLPWKERPFESLIPYASLPAMDVLEIGVGQGAHAQMIAPHCRSYTGIDLTDAACGSTRRRLELRGIPGRIIRMDAESMTFDPAAFDFIWSWGVIHHSADTARVLREMHRVLRPGGRATVMVYFRSPFQYYLINGLARGLMRGAFWSVGDIHRINQAATDGALARYFSMGEFKALISGLFDAQRWAVVGQKADAIPLPAGRSKDFLVEWAPDVLTRFVTSAMRLGTFLIVELKRL